MTTKINRKVVAFLLLAAMEFKDGKRRHAQALLERATEDEDFNETVDGLDQALSEDTGADDDFMDDIEDDEIASLVKPKRKAVKASETKTTKIDDDQESMADDANDNEEELRGDGVIKETSAVRKRQVRANLIALARTADE